MLFDIMKIDRNYILNSEDFGSPTTGWGGGFLNHIHVSQAYTSSIILLISLFTKFAFLSSFFILTIVACLNYLWILVICDIFSGKVK